MTTIMRGICLALLAAMPLLSRAQQAPAPVWPAQGQLVREGAALYALHDYTGAIAKYQAVTPGDTTYAQAQGGLALALSAAGRHPKAVATARRALALQPFEPGAYSTLALTQEASQQPDSALATYRRALRLFPYNHQFYYGQAQVLMRQNRLAEALASAQRSAELRPMHPGTHQLLGTLAARQGQTAHALISLLTYLALENDAAQSNGTLRQVELMAQNGPSLEVGDQVAPIAPNKAFAELDQLLNSKIALQKSYTGKVKFDAALVRQTQLLVEKFPVGGPTEDFWVQAYGPLITELRQADNLTAFTYLILRYAEDPQAVLWVRRNLNDTKKTLLATLQGLVKLRTRQIVAGSEPSRYEVAWFNDDSELMGLGPNTPVGDKLIATGEWIGIDATGAVSDRGRYDAQGRQVGEWQGLWPDGHLKHVYPYDAQGELTGTVKRYYPNGTQMTESPYLHGKLNGTANYYNQCGSLIDVQTYRDGLLEGPYKTYYPSGQLHYTSTMHSGETDGPEASFYADGSPEYTATSVKDKRQGPSPTYFADKQPAQSATYDQDRLQGDFKRYYADGTLKEQGRYEQGHRTGLWHEYTMSGKPYIDRNYDAVGLLHGDWREYNQQGQPFNVAGYEHGRVRHWKYLDGAGKTLSEGKVGSGRVAVRLFDADGHLKATGDYLNGVRVGEWKSYYFDGQLEELNHFDDQGRLVGVAEQYYQLGQLMSRTHYSQGEREGYYELYFVDGEPKQNGFYRAGERHGRWHDYFANGQVSEEYEYHRGQLNGPSRSFAPSGKPTQERGYELGKLHRWLSYDSTGQALDRIELRFDSKEATLRYANSRYRVGVACFELSGPAEWLQNDGRPAMRAGHLGGKYEGAYTTYWSNGKVRYKRTYRDDQPIGEWLEYYPSGQLSGKRFYNTAGMHGESSYYFPNGRLAVTENHLNGELNGIMRDYNPAGELLIERRYEHGLLRSYRGPGPADAAWLPHTNGRLTTTFANGKIAADEIFEHGWWGGPATYYYSSGAVFRRFDYRRTTGHGLRESFSPNGEPLAREYFEHGGLHGRCRYYRPDGTLEREVTYRCGDLNGPLTYCDAAGKPLRTEYYWNTILCGEKPGAVK